MACLNLDQSLNKAQQDLYFKRFELIDTQYNMITGNNQILESLIPLYKTQQQEFVALEKRIRGLKSLITDSGMYLKQIDLMEKLTVLYNLSSNTEDIQKIADQTQENMDNLLTNCVTALKNIDQSDICDVPCRVKPLKRKVSSDATLDEAETTLAEEAILSELTETMLAEDSDDSLDEAETTLVEDSDDSLDEAETTLAEDSDDSLDEAETETLAETALEKTLAETSMLASLDQSSNEKDSLKSDAFGEIPVTGGGNSGDYQQNARLNIVAKKFGLDPLKYDKKTLCKELALKLMTDK